MKKLGFLPVLISLMAFLATPVKADELICSQAYGQPVVCGLRHETVNTALGDINPGVLGAALLSSSFLLNRWVKKIRQG